MGNVENLESFDVTDHVEKKAGNPGGSNKKKGYGKHHRAINLIFELCDLMGFKVESRIVLRDKKTGKIWR